MERGDTFGVLLRFELFALDYTYELIRVLRKSDEHIMRPSCVFNSDPSDVGTY